MRLSDFDYTLPPERIAQYPCTPRDHSRLLIVPPGDAAFEDRYIHALSSLLRAGDVLVFNDTRVLPARLQGRRGEAKISITLNKEIVGGRWHAFARPAKRLREGDIISFLDDLEAYVEAKQEGACTLKFNQEQEELLVSIRKQGEMPLPPYIRKGKAEMEDTARYQTVYAEKEGAVAAPTAGLHFTPELLAALEHKGVEQCFVTLHVGAGTFLPVKTEDLDHHQMHAEYGEITAEVAHTINQARREKRRIIAVGTTSLRLLESAANEEGLLSPYAQETSIFIKPGYRFQIADGLLTNFHLPKSTLLMLVAAFSGHARILSAYQHAIRQEYRFYSYGDACLLWR